MIVTIALAAIVVWLVLMLASLNFGGWAHLLLLPAMFGIAMAARNRLFKRDRNTQQTEVRQ